jgi:hypothetical protein
MRKSIALVALVALALLLASPSFAQEARPVLPDDWAAIRSATPEDLEEVTVTTISPDGELQSLRVQVLKETYSRRVGMGEFQREVVMIPVPRREPVTVPPEDKPLVAPLGATIVYFPDGRCSPSIATVTFPDQEKVKCIAREARLAINRLNVQPGKNSPCWEFFGKEYENCIDLPARAPLGVSYGMSPRYVRGLLLGKEWEGCAAGISGNPIFVSLHDSRNVLPLVGWEAGNHQMNEILGRADITDGPLINQAKEEALTACDAR